MSDDDPWLAIIAKLQKDCPLIPYNGASLMFSSVRRMKAEKALGVPLHLRAGFAIPVATGHRPAEMSEAEWDAFYEEMCEELKKRYPSLHAGLFPSVEDGPRGTS